MQDADGVPVAVELITPDVGTARSFYSALLGWEVADGDGPVDATRDGDVVATIHPGDDAAAVWRVVFAGRDVDATRERVTAGGGQVVADDGGVIVVADPLRATLAISYDGPHDRLRPGPGRASWFEIMTTDPKTSDDFYRSVLATRVVDPAGGDDPSATMFALLIGPGGDPIGGRLALSADLAQTLGDRWMTYFAVDDVDAVAGWVTDLGGVVAVGPMDAPTGRVAAIIDPSGAVCTLLRPAERDETPPDG